VTMTRWHALPRDLPLKVAGAGLTQIIYRGVM
jgi:hypothetical protein